MIIKYFTCIDTKTPPKISQVAIKCIDKSSISSSVGASERTLREIMVQSHLYHPNITRLLEVLDSKDFVYLILEYESGGELFERLQKHQTTESESRILFRQLLSAIQYCHVNGVVHRDLKPENLLLDQNGNIKIIDFGFANILRQGSKLETFCGSPEYAPPEMIARKTYSGQEADIWSMGVILYILICGKLPFEDQHMGRLYTRIMSGNYSCPENTPEGESIYLTLSHVLH